MKQPDRINFQTIRMRLPLSYAAIALLAALALGAVMLTVLRQYYIQRERDYLLYTASNAAQVMAVLKVSGASGQIISSQLASLAYTSQARLRLLDENEKVLFDSGIPVVPFPGVMSLNHSVSAPYPPPGMAGGDVLFDLPLSESPVFIQGGGPDAMILSGNTISYTGSISATPGTSYFAVVPAPVSVYGFDWNIEPGSSGNRSGQVVRLSTAFNDRSTGSLVISDGPAYGTEIVASAAWAWLFASSVAVLLAGAAGWWVSRSFTRPLSALTHATQRMAAGDLAARAAVNSRDELEELGDDLNHMAGRIEEMVALLRQFASDAAHELQTPLTALRTNLDLAAAEPQPTRRQAALEQAQDQVERLSLLTRGLLDLSRIESGAGAGDRTEIDLAGLAIETSETYAARAEQAGLEFDLRLVDTPLICSANPVQLRRALANLLDNAIKFTPPGGSVTLGGERKGGEICLWVQDTGIGIPPEDLGQIFRRFHRGRNAAAYPGSGLGLAIVQATLLAHGGRLEVEALPGDGTRACICLPGLDPEDPNRPG